MLNKQSFSSKSQQHQALAKSLHHKQKCQPSNTRPTNLTAYTYAIISNISIVLSQINLKKLTHYFEPTLVLGVRGTLLFAFNLLYFVYTNKNYHVRDPIVFRAIIKRTTFGAVTLIMYLGSVKFLSIGVVNSLFNTMPIMTFFLDLIYYKKKVIYWFNLLMILTSFTGVLLIIQPPFLFGGQAPDHFIMYFVVLASALTGTLTALFIVDQIVVLLHGYLIQALTNYLLFIFIHHDDTKAIQYLHTMSPTQILISLTQLLLTVLFAFLTQYCSAKAAYLCSPALIMPFSYCSVVIGSAIDVLLFNASYGPLKILGMVMASVGLFSKFVALYMNTSQNQNIQNNNKPNEYKIRLPFKHEHQIK